MGRGREKRKAKRRARAARRRDAEEAERIIMAMSRESRRFARIQDASGIVRLPGESDAELGARIHGIILHPITP